MRVRIHRGAHEVGGTCIEVESSGSRIVLDVGRPLDAPRDEFVPLPDLTGLRDSDPSLLGLVISHGHQDHWGLIDQSVEERPCLHWWSIRIVSSMALTKESNPGVKNYITPGGFKRLRDELRFLAKERPAVTRVAAWAASNGDRSENADYQHNEGRDRPISLGPQRNHRIDPRRASGREERGALGHEQQRDRQHEVDERVRRIDFEQRLAHQPRDD